MRKKAIAVLFGGQSSEHEVSCISAATVIRNINPDNYEIHLVGITEDGKWVLAKDLEDMTSGNWKNSGV